MKYQVVKDFVNGYIPSFDKFGRPNTTGNIMVGGKPINVNTPNILFKKDDIINDGFPTKRYIYNKHMVGIMAKPTQKEIAQYDIDKPQFLPEGYYVPINSGINPNSNSPSTSIEQNGVNTTQNTPNDDKSTTNILLVVGGALILYFGYRYFTE
jgi:hypothetical protein